MTCSGYMAPSPIFLDQVALNVVCVKLAIIFCYVSCHKVRSNNMQLFD